ncbi:MAG: hypothetical protein KDG55_16410, partial [Rhodocyclaceae bacterium]|nr:hypothetical protein [Rhodocyclaceae bacterium]
GALVGWLLGLLLRGHWVPEYLRNVTTLAVVWAAFALANAVESESGLLAVTVMGIYLGNRKGVPIEEILAFKESLSLLLITVLFILLAARLDFARLAELGGLVIGVFLAVQFIARPLKVAYCTWGSSLGMGERALLAWIAPRGIVAAAVSALFAIKLEQLGFAQAELLVPMTFVVIIGTVVLQSLTASSLARWLGVSEPDPHGYLIIGANPLARAIAKALDQQKVRVMLTDTLWDNVSRARMAGLRSYYGNPLSEHAELYLDTSGLGHLLALTADAHLNGLACNRYRDQFGARDVFSLRIGGNASGRADVARQGRAAFGEEVNYVDLSRRLYRGAEIRRTNLSDTFTMAHFREVHGDRATPLFAVDAKGNLDVFSTDYPLEPGPGWSIIALIDPDPEEGQKARERGENGKSRLKAAQ